MKKTALFIKIMGRSKFQGDARLYKVTPPMSYDMNYETNKYDKVTKYIIVSACDTFDEGPETFIFPSDSKGNVINWGELNGSYRGGLDHEKALRRAGYEITDEKN